MAKIKLACAPESLKSIIICIVVFPSFPKEIALDMTFLLITHWQYYPPQRQFIEDDFPLYPELSSSLQLSTVRFSPSRSHDTHNS